MPSFSSSFFPPNIFFSFLSILCWSSQTHGFYLLIHLTSFSFLPPRSQSLALCSSLSNPCWNSFNPHTASIHTFPKTLQPPTSYITVAMPVCPRSVSCHPMGSMSFKTLQAQPLPHCRSHERNLSREAASSSSKTARRRTTGPTQVGHVINQHLWLTFKLFAIIFLILILTDFQIVCEPVYAQMWCIFHFINIWWFICVALFLTHRHKHTTVPTVHLSAAVS